MIRVRVAGVTGPNPVSLERIKEVAQLIAVRTHLTVDIVSGSSPAPTAVSLPAGTFRQPQLLLTEDWVKKGVAVAILAAVDKESVLLFTLILVVCALFVANSATAAVRSRRRELGVLACLGGRGHASTPPCSASWRCSGWGPESRAGRCPCRCRRAAPARFARPRDPGYPGGGSARGRGGRCPRLAGVASRADSRDPATRAGRPAGPPPGGVMGLAVVNVLRTPGRSLVGAFSLAVGVAALTMLTA